MDADWPELFADVFDLADYAIIRIDGTRIELSPNECVVLGVLAQARGRWKAKQTLAGAIYGGGEWTRAWEGVLRHCIFDLRTKVTGCSFAIESDRGRGLGWRLTGAIRVRAADGTLTFCR